MRPGTITKLGKILTATAFAGAMALASTGPASAGLITVGGITFPVGGATTFTTSIFESAFATIIPGTTLVSGIGNVTGIPSGGSVGTGELTFGFSGYKIEQITQASATAATILFSGGAFNFFSQSPGNFTANSGLSADTTSATDGTSWLKLAGADTGTACTAATCTGAAITLVSNITFNPVTLAQTGGNSTGAFTLAGGAAAGFVDAGSPFLFTSNSTSGEILNTDFPVTATNVNFTIQTIPEPGTLALFGFGLLGFGFASQRRRRKMAA